MYFLFVYFYATNDFYYSKTTFSIMPNFSNFYSLEKKKKNQKKTLIYSIQLIMCLECTTTQHIDAENENL